MKTGALFTILMFILNYSIDAQDLTLEFLVGKAEGKIRDLEQYQDAEFHYISYDEFLSPVVGTKLKYQFYKYALFSFGLDYYKFKTETFNRLSFDDYDNIQSTLGYFWSISRERIAPSVSLGLIFPLSLTENSSISLQGSIGVSYLYNYKNAMTGHKHNYSDGSFFISSTDLSTVNFGSSGSFGRQIDLQGRIQYKRIYIGVNYTSLFEQPSSPGIKTLLTFAHDIQFLTLGLGYCF